MVWHDGNSYLHKCMVLARRKGLFAQVYGCDMPERAIPAHWSHYFTVVGV